MPTSKARPGLGSSRAVRQHIEQILAVGADGAGADHVVGSEESRLSRSFSISGSSRFHRAAGWRGIRASRANTPSGSQFWMI
jgi:hypothetical protein